MIISFTLSVDFYVYFHNSEMEHENNVRLLYIFLFMMQIFFDFLKALPMKKIFQEHETNVDFFTHFLLLLTISIR
jgi:hypothetical protein